MLRISRRGNTTKKYEFMCRAFGVLGALLVTSILIIFMKHNPLEVFWSMIKGSMGSGTRIENTLLKAIPLVIVALGLSISFRMKFWNIGGEGQIMIGAISATYIALNFSNLPSYILIPIMFLVSFLAGGLWGVIPAYFKVKYNANETLFTLMLNYIALGICNYLQYVAWKDPESMGFPKIAQFDESAHLPEIFGIHIGWIVACLLVVFLFYFINHTKKGYEINVVGGSQNTAKYAGMNVKKIILQAMLLSGGICGIAGMIQVAGVSHTLTVNTSSGYGFTAIIIAWLAKLKSYNIVVVAILFAAMLQGGLYIQAAFQIPAAVAGMLQGVILLFVLGSEFFIYYKISGKNEGKVD